MKKRISILIVLSMVLILLVSCGDATYKKSETTTEPTVASEPTTDAFVPEENVNLQIAQGENSGVVLTLKTDKPVYKPDDTLTVTDILENNSQKDIYQIQGSYEEDRVMTYVILTSPSGEIKRIGGGIGLDVVYEALLPAGEKTEKENSCTKWGAFEEREIIKGGKLPQPGKYVLTATTQFDFESHINDETIEIENKYIIKAECCFYVTEDGKMPSDTTTVEQDTENQSQYENLFETTQDNLTLSVGTDKKVYTVGDKVYVSFTIRNNGSKTAYQYLTTPCASQRFYTEAAIYNAEGKELYRCHNRGWSGGSLYKLKQGKSVRRDFRFPPKYSYHRPLPEGTYTVKATAKYTFDEITRIDNYNPKTIKTECTFYITKDGKMPS